MGPRNTASRHRQRWLQQTEICLHQQRQQRDIKIRNVLRVWRNAWTPAYHYRISMPTVPVWWSVERDVPWSSTEQSFISYLHVISIKKLMISNFLFHNFCNKSCSGAKFKK